MVGKASGPSLYDHDDKNQEIRDGPLYHPGGKEGGSSLSLQGGWPKSLYVDYTGRWGIHEAFLHNSSGNDANVTILTKLAKSRYIGIIS